MSRKGAKLEGRTTSLRSETRTKAKPHHVQAADANLKKKLAEALEQQAATTEVLQRHSSSPGDLQPVFDTMLENALRICEAKFGVLFRIDEEVTYPVAMLNLPPF